MDTILETAVAQNAFDEFADFNYSPDFSDFLSTAKRFGLRYVAESPITDWSARSLSRRAQEFLAQLEDDPERRMALQDCIRLTTFHSSLLCHESSSPAPVPLIERVLDMLVASRTGRQDESTSIFVSPTGLEAAIANPVLQAFLGILEREWPRRIHLREALGRAGHAARSTEKVAAESLVALWETGMVDFYCFPSPATAGGVYPLAFPLAREKAREGQSVPAVTGSTVELPSERDRELMLLLDGSHNFSELRVQLQCSANELAGRLDRLARLGVMTA